MDSQKCRIFDQIVLLSQNLIVMTSHYSLSNTQFETQFSKGTFPVELFDHEAHLRLAWIHLKKYGLHQAITNIQKQLKNYTTIVGASGKYNTTVTIAAIRAVHHFMQRSQSQTFQEFIKEYPRLKTNFKELMHSHYSVDIFSLDAAKSSFVEPDLLPF